jgi:sulfur carrier protein
MKLVINGEEKIFDFDNLSLDEFLKNQNIRIEYVAIAVNCKFIPKSMYKDIELQEGDDIEVLTPMQGG